MCELLNPCDKYEAMKGTIILQVPLLFLGWLPTLAISKKLCLGFMNFNVTHIYLCSLCKIFTNPLLPLLMLQTKAMWGSPLKGTTQKS